MGSFKPPCIGDLKSYVIAQEVTMVPDEVGGEKTSWTTSTQFFAKVEWRKGGEPVVAGRLQPFSYALITARFDPSITAATRLILDDGSILNVKDVENVDQLYTWMRVSAEVGTGS